MANFVPLQICIYTYVVFIEIFGNLWSTSLLPQIVTDNFKISDYSKKSSVGAMYTVYYYIGLVIGSLTWPTIVRGISKRNCILIGILGQAISNYLVGLSPNMLIVYIWRFIFGFFHISNTVAKDFIYEFAPTKYRQYIFSFRGVAVMTATFFGPFFGYQIYYYCNADFSNTLFYISIAYISASILFFIGFYLISIKPLEIIEHNPDEHLSLLREVSHDLDEKIWVTKPEHIGLINMFKYCLKRKQMRDIVIGFAIVCGAYDALLFVAIFYIETPWNDYGLGLTPKEVSVIVFLIFIPILLIMMISPLLVPKHWSIFGYTRVILVLLIMMVLLLPGFRDIFSPLKCNQRIYAAYSFVSLFMIVSPNLFSPFLNLFLNDKIPKNGRTSFNSILFIGMLTFLIILFLTIVPLFSISMYDPRFQAFAPYNKYLCFLVLGVLMSIGAVFLWNPTPEPKKIKSNLID